MERAYFGEQPMDKDFQIAILKECAKYYPLNALTAWGDLLDMAPGDSTEKKQAALIAHMAALEEFGYIKDFHDFTTDGFLKFNRAFHTTGQGLLAAGEDILHPDPYADLREAIYDQAQALRSLSKEDAKTLRGVLSSLPRVALERLRDKGLDLLLDLVCG